MSKRGDLSGIDLPPGWKRVERKKKGKSSGNKTEVLYISPANVEVKSMAKLQKVLPEVDFSYFDFRTGKSMKSEARKLKEKHLEIIKEGTSFPRRSISSSSILGKVGQSVTMINSHESSEVRVSAGQKTYRRKPRQIFWNRRLTRNRTIEMSKGDSKNSQSSSLCDNNNSTASLESKLKYELPDPIKPLLETPAEVVLSSTVGCLHLNSQQELHIVGQQPNHFKAIQNNPAVWVNYSQPMFEKFLVTEEHIRRQEEKVVQLRTKLLQLQE